MKTTAGIVLFLVLALLTGLPMEGQAAEDVSKVIAVRGKAVIEREKKETEARVNAGLLIVDKVSTREQSRAKLLFMDDSVLTLGEKSQVVIQEYVFRKDERGRSVFNLVEGVMRTVVGRTRFEVHTPTAVAAARGTIINFRAGEKSGKRFTQIQCVEGEVDVKSASDKILDNVMLTAGMEINVYENEQLGLPSVISVAQANIFNEATDMTQSEIRVPDPMQVGIALAGVAGGGGRDYHGGAELGTPGVPIASQQAPIQAGTPVTISVIVP
jgi:hypothetical protein